MQFGEMRARSEAGRRRSPISFPAPGADPFRCAGATDGLRGVPPRFGGLRLGGWRKADGRWRGRGDGAFRPQRGGRLRLRRRFRRRNGSAGLSCSSFCDKRARRLQSAARALFLRGIRLGVAGGPRRGGGLVRTASRLLRSAAFSLSDRSDGGVHFEPEQRRDVVVGEHAFARRGGSRQRQVGADGRDEFGAVDAAQREQAGRDRRRAAPRRHRASPPHACTCPPSPGRSRTS